MNAILAGIFAVLLTSRSRSGIAKASASFTPAIALDPPDDVVGRGRLPTPHLPLEGAPHPAISALSTRYRPRQRAPPRSGYRGSDLVPWHTSDRELGDPTVGNVVVSGIRRRSEPKNKRLFERIASSSKPQNAPAQQTQQPRLEV